MAYERVDLNWQHGKRPHRRWRTGNLNGSNEQFVTVGELEDGRFYAWHTGRKGGAYVFVTEREACDVVDRWLADGRTWSPVPAVFDARGNPADGGRWWLRGQEWMPGEPPASQ
jgi:hypothetical protein